MLNSDSFIFIRHRNSYFNYVGLQLKKNKKQQQQSFVYNDNRINVGSLLSSTSFPGFSPSLPYGAPSLSLRRAGKREPWERGCFILMAKGRIFSQTCLWFTKWKWKNSPPRRWFGYRIPVTINFFIFIRQYNSHFNDKILLINFTVEFPKQVCFHLRSYASNKETHAQNKRIEFKNFAIKRWTKIIG